MLRGFRDHLRRRGRRFVLEIDSEPAGGRSPTRRSPVGPASHGVAH
jgi:hypothetical protein